MYSNYPRNDGISLSIIPFFFFVIIFLSLRLIKRKDYFFFSSNIYRNSAIIKARTKFLRVYFAFTFIHGTSTIFHVRAFNQRRLYLRGH